MIKCLIEYYNHQVKEVHGEERGASLRIEERLHHAEERRREDTEAEEGKRTEKLVIALNMIQTGSVPSSLRTASATVTGERTGQCVLVSLWQNGLATLLLFFSIFFFFIQFAFFFFSKYLYFYFSYFCPRFFGNFLGITYSVFHTTHGMQHNMAVKYKIEYVFCDDVSWLEAFNQ